MPVYFKTRDDKLLKAAIEAAHEEAGVRFTITDEQVYLGDGHAYADALIEIAEVGTRYACEVRRWLQHTKVGPLIATLERVIPNDMPGVRGLLVTDYVNPRMAAALKERNIEFIDAAGNAFLNAGNIYIYIKGNKPKAELTTAPAVNRAFEAAGVKLIYALLRDPELIAKPYRDIAATAGIANGTVGGVINGLKDAGFVRGGGRGGNRRQLQNLEDLYRRWVEVYATKLKPKLALGNFYTDDPDWWTGVKLDEFGGYWGGEIAAAHLTRYITPKVATVYLPETQRDVFLKLYRFRKKPHWMTTDEAGVVQLYKIFWQAERLGEHDYEATDPLLTHADLMDTGDTRNMEVAKKLYEEQIAGHLRQAA